MQSINIEELTLKQVREITGLVNVGSPSPTTLSSLTNHPYEVGKNYFIRTVTHHYTGKLTDVFEHELVLTSAAWIADDGRFADAVKNAKFAEVEPYPDGALVVVGRGAILDAVQIGETLPRSQK